MTLLSDNPTAALIRAAVQHERQVLLGWVKVRRLLHVREGHLEAANAVGVIRDKLAQRIDDEPPLHLPCPPTPSKS